MAQKAKTTKAKFEYKPDIYNDDKNTEQDYQDAVSNKEALAVELREFDLRPFASELYNQQLPQFIHLEKLVLENCNLDSFVPKGLGKLKVLSLMGNSIPNMNLLRLTRMSQDEAAARPQENNRTFIPEVSLESLNLSNNNFECFPWVAICQMKDLTVINLGRNRISQIFDAQEKKEMQRIMSTEFSGVRRQPFDVFKKLVNLDLSSNLLTQFPTELNVLKLEELNLMNNLIETIPNSFYSGSEISRSLKRLLLNQNELKELDSKISNISQLEVLGIAMTKITKLPQTIARISSLREIYVKETPLKQPKLALAMRGIGAIREFFQQNEEDFDEENDEGGRGAQAMGADDADQKKQAQSRRQQAGKQGAEDATADKLHVLSEEFAQAILFKKKELTQEKASELEAMQEDDPEGYKRALMVIEEKAARIVMQDYFDQDQLNLLPKTIIQTPLLTQMKNNRELPIYGFKQSMNMIQQQISHKIIGDGNKMKSLQDVMAFKTRIDQIFEGNQLAVISGRIRVEQADLYVQLRKVSARMSQYHYRFHIIYWVTYLEAYEDSCNQFFNHKMNSVTNIADLYNPEFQDVLREYYDIEATSSIFIEKLGRHPETRHIFTILGFEALPPNDPNFTRTYRIKKDRDRLRKVRRISELLKKIANMDL